MNRKAFIFAVFWVILLGAIGIAAFSGAQYYRGNTNKAKAAAGGKANKAVERVGERITYNIRMGGLNVGKAQFYHVGRVQVNGRESNLFTFNTKMVRFSDSEKIYCDPQTLLPLRVERLVSTWPFPEKITEEYDQKKGSVAIKKCKRSKCEDILIEKGTILHNSILLPYAVRAIAHLEPGWSMFADLPTQRFKITLASIEEVKVPAGVFKAYHFESEPSKFEIWVSADERRIPLKIKGLGGLGYVLLMKEYSYDP